MPHQRSLGQSRGHGMVAAVDLRGSPSVIHAFALPCRFTNAYGQHLPQPLLTTWSGSRIPPAIAMQRHRSCFYLAAGSGLIATVARDFQSSAGKEALVARRLPGRLRKPFRASARGTAIAGSRLTSASSGLRDHPHGECGAPTRACGQWRDGRLKQLRSRTHRAQ